MTVITDKPTLRFVVSNGKVWCSDLSTAAEPEEDYVERVAEALATNPNTIVQIPGDRQHSRLVTQLVNRGFMDCIRIGSPDPIREIVKTDPRQACQDLSFLSGLPTIAGGWRKLTTGDVANFSFIVAHAIRQNMADSTPYKAELDQVSETIFKMHPAWPAFSFIKTINMEHAQTLAMLIEDPRWYVDIERPDRESKLRSYLGLYRTNMEMMDLAIHQDSSSLQGEMLKGSAYRSMVVLCSVFHEDTFEELDARGAEFDEESEPSSNFLLSFLLRSNLTRDRVNSMLRTLELYISFVRQVWLHNTAPPGRRLFVPEYFFQGFTSRKLAARYAEDYHNHLRDSGYEGSK